MLRQAMLEDIMTESVVTLKDDASIGQAAHILLRFRINGVLIVSKQNKDHIVGIISTNELLYHLNNIMSNPGNRISGLDQISNTPVSFLCNKDIITIPLNTKVKKVIAIMDKKMQYTLPIVENGKLIGVVGRHDILNAAFGS